MPSPHALNLGSIHIPMTAATKTFAILAKRGAGKSYTGAVMAEEFYKVGIPFVVFDPIDVWWGLRLAHDGKHKGLPVVVLGKDHADIELEQDMGPAIAQAIVTNQVSCILSTFGMSKRAQRKLITEFSEAILKINNTQRHIFIEEAHEFVPQRVFGEMGSVFNAVSNLVVMGRNRGLGVTLINQRAATLHKDVLTQIDTLLAFRNVAPQDRQALHEWVESHAAEGDFAAFLQSLPSLPTGEDWLWSPEFLDTFERIKIRRRETFHPDREQLGTQVVIPQIEQGNIQTFIDQFHTLTKKQPSPPSDTHPTNTKGGRFLLQEKQALIEAYEAKLQAKDQQITQLQEKLNVIQQIISGEAHQNQKQLSSLVSVSHASAGALPSVNQALVELWIGKLGPGTGAARILQFLAQKAGLKFTRAQIALAVGMSSRGGAYHRYLSHLKQNQLITEQEGLVTVSSHLLQ